MHEAAMFLAKAVALALGIMSIVLHEVAHGFVAFRLGDPTAYLKGRLTLNPVKHIDPFMTVIMPIILFIGSGGTFIFGGAKPVPVNPYRFRNARKGLMLTGIAGPATNILLALTAAVLLRPFVVIFGLEGWQVSTNPLLYIVYFTGMWNILIAVFNMLPIPPLDGSRVMMYLLPRELAYRYEKLEQFGLVLVLVVLLVFREPLHVLFAYVAVGFSWVAGIAPYF
jgi:Zn-dependent protease